MRFDPNDNGRSREPLPSNNSSMFVESIIRSGFNVIINGLNIPTDLLSQAQIDIQIAVEKYLKAINPFIDGLDAQLDKNNVMTNMSLGSVIENVAISYGGFFSSVLFNQGGLNIPEYTFSVKEKAKLNPGGISYVN